MATAEALALTTKDALLAAIQTDRPAHRRYVEAWGGDVFIRALSGNERDDVETWQQENPRMIGYRAYVVSLALCDESAVSLGLDALDVNELGKANGGAIDFLFWEVMKLSRYTPAEVERLEKNSQAGQND